MKAIMQEILKPFLPKEHPDVKVMHPVVPPQPPSEPKYSYEDAAWSEREEIR